MRGKERKPSGALTPEENDRALAELAVKLGELDAAEGVFGEAMLDEELDEVAGGKTVSLPGVPMSFQIGSIRM